MNGVPPVSPGALPVSPSSIQLLNPAALPTPEGEFPFELPSEVILSALGTNYNTVVRAWLLSQYRAQLDHHKLMVQYYKTMINKLESQEIKYEKEPENIPVSSAASNGGPIKLSDLAKQRPVVSAQPKPTPIQQQAAAFEKKEEKKEKKEDKKPVSGHGGNIALSTSLASDGVKFDKKPTKVKVDVEEDEDNAQQQMTHFARPQPKRAGGAKAGGAHGRSDIKRGSMITRDMLEDNVATWQETPTAFADKQEKKGLFGGLFGKDKDTTITTSGSSINTAQTTSTIKPLPNASNNNSINNSSSGPAANIQSNSFGQTYGTQNNASYGTNPYGAGAGPAANLSNPNSFGTANRFGTGLGGGNQPPSLPPSIPPVPPSIPPAPPTPSSSSGGNTPMASNSGAGGPPPLSIPRPPAAPLHTTGLGGLPIPPPPATPTHFK